MARIEGLLFSGFGVRLIGAALAVLVASESATFVMESLAPVQDIFAALQK